jgi:hypothetical protein
MKVLLASFLFSVLVIAQSFQGSLRGRITDPSGSPAAGARITLTDEATALSRSTVTNDSGEYVFSAVSPAIYTVAVEATGFKKLDRKGVEVTTQEAVTVDLSLQLGQLTESVNVTAEAPALETGDASTGQLLDAQQITDLTILGRNPYFEGKLAQGVVFAANPKFARMQDQNGNSQVSIAGGPLRTNNYLVDGISIADSNNRAVIVPSPEAVQELKIQTTTYDAEVSRTGGGAFNTLLRSGSNQLHRPTGWPTTSSPIKPDSPSLSSRSTTGLFRSADRSLSRRSTTGGTRRFSSRRTNLTGRRMAPQPHCRCRHRSN